MRKLLENTVPFPDVVVTSNIDLTVQMEKRELQKDICEYEFFLKWDAEQAKSEDARVAMVWSIPLIDVQYMWHPNARPRRVLDADWRLNISSMLTCSAPLAMLFNSDDQNSFTFATDEIKKVTNVRFGVDDEHDAISGEISMGLRQFVGKESGRLKVRADFRKIPYYQVLEDVRLWWEEVLELVPMPVPQAARKPVYSSWYSFHQNISAGVLEKECLLAKKMGMDTIIVDDGWQTADGSGGYGYCGDWAVYPGKIPDMREHVRRVHEAGLKYMIWFSVPFLGYCSKNWDRFKDKILRKIDRNNTAVLDPRYPDVREFLTGLYVHFLKEYDIDGFKLDFVDQFRLYPENTVKPGMDYDCVQDATERLMMDITQQLRMLKPDVMIEFRQHYIGPGMRQFGNMFRVSDCPCDIATNRIGIADLRLLSGSTAVHSDMITWNDDENTEDAALQILAAIFGVIQFSKVIETMKPGHKKMAEFWLGFARKNEKLLQESEFIAYEPQFLYPVIKACDAAEEIIGVYAENKVIFPDWSKEKHTLLNATKRPELYVSVAEDCRMQVRVRDCCGSLVRDETLELAKGIVALNTPRSGLVELTKKIQIQNETYPYNPEIGTVKILSTNLL